MIYGITGMPLSGKTVAANKLEKEGYSKIDMGDVVREEMKKRNIPVSNTGDFVNRIREDNGFDAIAQLTIPKIKQKDTRTIVITGMRSLAEKNTFETELDTEIKMIALWSPEKTRKSRRQERRRKEDIEGDRFRERDQRELDNGVGNLMALSDHLIVNQDKSIKELEEKVTEIVK